MIVLLCRLPVFCPCISPRIERCRLGWRPVGVVLVSSSRQKRFRALKTGEDAAGIITPITFHRLQPMVDSGWATRAIAFLILTTMMVPAVGMRMHTKPSTHRLLFEARAWRELQFVVDALGMFFGCLGLYIELFYVQNYAIEDGIIGNGRLRSTCSQSRTLGRFSGG